MQHVHPWSNSWTDQAAQHSLHAYLQTWDWMLLRSMYLNHDECGWTVGVHGYEPVPTLGPMTPKELLEFTSCNCHGDCSTQQCNCKKNSVQCISACRICKGITCKNWINGGKESREDSDIEFWGVWQWEPYLNCCVYSNKCIYLLKGRFASSGSGHVLFH